MSNPKRKQLLVDRDVQGTIIKRVLIYAACCILFVIVPLLIAYTINNPSELFYENLPNVWAQTGYAITVMAVTVPLVIMDILRLSNRFVGPIFRLRREISMLAAGEEVRPLKFRDGDYWQDLADSLNKIAQRLQANETSSHDGDSAEPFEEKLDKGHETVGA